MSGKRQHTIPQFLLRGFSVPTSSGKNFVCRVFKRDAASYPANIINVGVQNYFYSDASSFDFDATLTKMEPDFAKLLGEIRRGKQSALSSPQLPKMLAHFETRTRCLRESLLQETEILLREISRILSEGNNFKAWAEKFMRSNSEDLRKAIIERLRASALPDEFHEPVRMLIHRFAPDIVDQIPTEEIYADWKSGLDQFVRNTVKSRHIQFLDNPAMLEEKEKKYENLSYTVLPITSPPMILGDSIVLFQVTGQPCYKNHLDPDDILIAVYLPLNSNYVLVGAPQKQHSLPSDLRKATARCSLEFFVASENANPLETLQPCIGAEADLLSVEEIKRKADDILFEDNISISHSFVSRYGIRTVRTQENQGSSRIALALLTQWGYQGFTLSPNMAESLSRRLALLLKQ